MQWQPAPRAVRPTAAATAEAARPAAIIHDSAVQLAAVEQPALSGESPEDAGRSVVVRRENAQGVTVQGDYDPFDEDDGLSVAQMPAVEPAAQPELGDPFSDPFEADDAAQQQPAEPEQSAPAAEEATEAESSETPAADEPAETQEDSAPAESPVDEPVEEEPATEAPLEEPATSEPLPKPKNNAASPNTLRDEVEQGAADEVVRGPAPVEPPANDLREVERGTMDDELPVADSAPAEESDAADDSAVPEFDYENLESHLQATPDESSSLPPLTPEQQEARRKELEQESIENEKDCDRILEIVKQRNIESISLDIGLKGTPGEDFPFACNLGNERFAPRSWSEITYLWKAAGMCHKPLYFEQTQLERYGHDCGPVLQPIVSGAHFFATLPILPYSMGIESPGECIYTLGYYRPGSCAPYMIPAMPFTWRAAFYEGAVWTGGVFLFP